MRAPLIFTGHMIDKVGRRRPDHVPRFPAAKEAQIAASIAAALGRLDPGSGYCSAACGGDVLFIEQMLARGAEVHLVLPYAEDLFVRDCIQVPEEAGPDQQFQAPAGPGWLARYQRLRERVSSVLVLGDRRPQDNAMASDYCNRVFLGLGLLRAQADGVPLRLLALWDGWSGDGPGGTRSLVRMADALGVGIEYLPDLRPERVEDVIHTASPPPGIGSSPVRATLGSEPPQQICAVLFADVVQFARIDESRLPAFVRGYLRPLAGMIQDARHGGYGPIDFNTWGDGLFCVFDSALKAGLFALEMQAQLQGGQSPDDALRLRIALHAGPVFRIPDPVFPKDTFVGTHISLASRIEPVTDEGAIFCSRPFAAIATAEGVRDFGFEYVGERMLAKDAGAYPLYRMQRTAPVARS